MRSHPDSVTITTSNYSEYIDNLDRIYFSTSSVLEWYCLTSTEKLFEKYLSDDWLEIYSSMTESDRISVHNTFYELENIELNKFDISNNISNWTTSEFFLNLNLLDKYELSIVLVDIAVCNNQSIMLEKVNDYNISTVHKTLILYLIGNYNWSYIDDSDKKAIFDYFCEIYNTIDLGAILETLGYRIEYHSDGSLTAWW
jgi:hypothetical protein